MPPSPPARVLFFDGQCGLCHGWVRLLASVDRHRRLQFAPLQGATAAARLPHALTTTLDTIVYQHGGHTLTHSSAVLRALADTGGWRRVFAGLLWVPPSVRDAAYRLVARHRHRLFGVRTGAQLLADAFGERLLP